jgi:predicted transcriptional regulator
MSEMVPIHAHIDADTLALVSQAADGRGISDAEYVAEAVRRLAESDADMRAFLQAGIDAADRGDVVPHDEVMTELEGMIAQHRGRCIG